jgi:hypothetical protein
MAKKKNGISKIDKLEAASRQLNTAISLWFNDGDTVSIHVLACSAYQIVHDINRSQGGEELIYDSLVLKDEYRRDSINFLKQHYNFFKHAGNDPAGAIEFNPIITELFILYTSIGLTSLGHKADEVLCAFNIYYAFHHPNHLTEVGKAMFIDPVPEEIRNWVLSTTKKDFFEVYTLGRRLAGKEPFTSKKFLK